MKKDIHPSYKETEFSCACGHVIHTKSVLGGKVEIEICSQCHPFYTGKQKFVDTTGRIDRFKKRYHINT